MFYRHSTEYRCQLGVGGGWLVCTMGWTNVLVSSLILVGVGVLFTTKPFSNHAEKLVDKMHQVIARLSGSTQPQGRSGATKSAERLFTKEEIKDYDGKTKSEIYIALVGSVYDVTKGARFYAAGNHYGGFSGKHAGSCGDQSALYCNSIVVFTTGRERLIRTRLIRSST